MCYPFLNINKATMFCYPSFPWKKCIWGWKLL